MKVELIPIYGGKRYVDNGDLNGYRGNPVCVEIGDGIDLLDLPYLLSQRVDALRQHFPSLPKNYGQSRGTSLSRFEVKGGNNGNVDSELSGAIAGLLREIDIPQAA